MRCLAGLGGGLGGVLEGFWKVFSGETRYFFRNFSGKNLENFWMLNKNRCVNSAEFV